MGIVEPPGTREGRGGETAGNEKAGKEAEMKAPPFRVTESDVMTAVHQALSVHGIFHWRNNTGAHREKNRFIRYGHPGSSDYIGICPDGRFLAVECKRPGGRPSENQTEFINRINGSHGVAIMADSVESLIRQLKEKGVIHENETD
jgi:hypothetical protein